jgi:hypothetical protein
MGRGGTRRRSGDRRRSRRSRGRHHYYDYPGGGGLGGVALPWVEQDAVADEEEDGAEDFVDSDEPLPVDLASATRSIRRAVERPRCDWLRVDGLDVDLGLPIRAELDDVVAGEAQPDNVRHRQYWFHALFSTIQSDSRIRRLALRNGDLRSFGSVRGRDFPTLRDSDLFFGTVLPNHPSLRQLDLVRCRIWPRHVRLWADALPHRPATAPLKLSLEGISLNSDCFRSIKTMLQSGARVGELSVVQCRMDATACRLVCEGASESRHLETLRLEVTGLVPGCVDAAICASSSLLRLDVRSRNLADDFLAALAVALRSNRVLEELGLHGSSNEHNYLHFRGLLRSHNYTLSRLALGFLTPHNPAPGYRVDTLLRRNRRVRQFLQCEPQCHVPCPALWPMVLQRIGTSPNLVYRFLRSGNVGTLSGQMVAMVQAARRQRKSTAANKARRIRRRNRNRERKRWANCEDDACFY